ncbi:helix-turn-helix domain-containing protein [Sunxiuqinia elliptica]|uniref:Excisionase family DNA binding protein n=1 Tax=Sunxiuqinia elliptica TaxID=655355 RepID=A0A4R6GXC4_9BACT|nr:helix-turn-helix domain-containing protein [Sunxiuqinia elliptica]TDN99987.1 excisionase family DNA binding protein [Sunxiuqinia elliptica]TDO57179.1 excisionase family DNA binding protein [Sunxiuqinia elliptica]
MEQNLSFDQLPTAVSQLSEKLDRLEKLFTQKQEFPTVEQPEQLFSIDQAAEFLNLSKPTLYSKVSRKEIPYMKRSKRLYFSRTELMDYLKAGRRKSNAEIQAEAENYLKNGRA